MKRTIFCIILLSVLISYKMLAMNKDYPCVNQDTLVVLWTSNDKVQTLDMILWYTGYAKSQNWWKEIIIITWGPSNELIATDKEIQEKIRQMISDGVKFKACKGCADKNEISDDLTRLGIEVVYVGGELTHFLKGGYPLLTF